ncbi:restriction endonuclease subunit S [Micromonospora sp. 15K316]|uniref:restriction endonuclease subunit S n=1 Tax=Micromonospora sp. 15K316 TaxID=2530376 RepID=UPI00104907D3|nr:restriction endonuclease subunit S [Micromonospora sp. 15K316]TDC36144.1 restriction endonuclease subunit S [Micromonospora sp. 15K316]
MPDWPFVEYRTLSSSERSAFSMGPFGSKITKENYVAAGVPVVRGVNLARGIFVDDDFVYIEPQKADELIAANVAPGDLIFTHRGTIGQVSMVPRRPRFDRYVIGSSQVKTRLAESVAVPEFYYYWFRSPEGQRSILANASTVGVPGIATPLTSIKGLRVPLPPLTTQRSIAEALGSLDAKIAVNDRIAAAYEGLFQAKFTALGTTVEGDCAITELVEFNPRTPRPAQGNAVYVDMAALPTRQSSIRTWAYRPPKGGSRFQNGDTLLARITPCLENGKTGFVNFLNEDETGIGSTEFIVMRSKKGVPPEFSYFLARDERFRKNAIRKMAGSSGRQRVSAADAAHFFVHRPDSGQLAAFGAEVEVAFRHLRSLMEESRVLERLRDMLLPEVMSGRLRVKDAEKIAEEAI